MIRELLIALAIVSGCLIVHVAGIMLMADWLMDRREYFERNATKGHFALLLISLFAGIMCLHLIQTALWAAFI